MQIKYSTIIPVYKNEDSIPRLLNVLVDMHQAMGQQMEAVFVIDGSPDRSYQMLKDQLGSMAFPTQLIVHSKNFGSFAAIRTGLAAAKGEYFAVIAADLQEPPELIQSFYSALEKDECDVATGNRTTRNDSLFANISSRLFWWIYRKYVVPEMPVGGVDVFGCNRIFRDQLLKLEESYSSLIALIFWLGFRRKEISYKRRKREEGVSAWTLSKKIDYMLDSIFAFTNLPIKLLTRIGGIGLLSCLVFALVIAVGRLSGGIEVTGYTTTMLTILTLGSLNLLGVGLVGNYAWRSYENSKKRPLAITSITVLSQHYE